jgi:predicted MFS family arabinose efflux permease
VIARQFLPESIWLDLFWPVFGLGVCTGALLSTQLSPTRDRRTLLCVGFLVQAGGLTISLISPSVTGFVVGSFLLGLPFTALSFFAMQEARRLRGGTAASFMGLLTATYGLGQVLGPLLVAWMLGLTDARGGFDRALATACAALLTGAATFAYLRRRYPAAAVG